MVKALWASNLEQLVKASTIAIVTKAYCGYSSHLGPATVASHSPAYLHCLFFDTVNTLKVPRTKQRRRHFQGFALDFPK